MKDIVLKPFKRVAIFRLILSGLHIVSSKLFPVLGGLGSWTEEGDVASSNPAGCTIGNPRHW